MAKAKCKCEEAECECPEWIFTFADLVMLMMGFFVILWVLKPSPGKDASTVENEDWIKVAAKIREAFDYLPDPQSKDPVDIQMLLNKLEKMRPLNGPGSGGKIERENQGAKGKDEEVTSIRPGKQAVIGGRLVFEPGLADLPAEVKQALDEIAVKVRGHRNIVIIKGHTSLDDVAENATAEQKMDLSLRRAQTVADYLTAKDVEPEIIRVQGCSTFEPVIQRTYVPNSQTLNRRVEVEVTATLVEELQSMRKEDADRNAAAGKETPAVPAATHH